MSPPPKTPAVMPAIEVEGGKGPAEALRLVEAPVPAPEAGEILIRVAAAGVNRPDLLQRRGLYPPPPGASPRLGLEVAGTVEAVGAGVERWRPGDRVAALTPGGGYAGFCRVDARHALPVPEGLSLVEAAALPETVFTVFANVFEDGALKPGETLLVHGATSGIGVTAIKLARALGARVVGTSRGAAKAEQARALGADLALDAADGRFAEAVRAFGGADVVLDMVGAPYLEENLACLNEGGRIVYVATQGGAVAPVDLMALMRRRLRLSGSTLRPRSADEKARLARALEARAWPLFGGAGLRPEIDRVFPLAEAGAAHVRLEGGEHVGKVVLAVDPAA